MSYKNSCEICAHRYKGDEKMPPHCRRYPPRPLAIPTKNKITGQPGIEVQPLISPLMPEGACGEFCRVWSGK